MTTGSPPSDRREIMTEQHWREELNWCYLDHARPRMFLARVATFVGRHALGVSQAVRGVWRTRAFDILGHSLPDVRVPQRPCSARRPRASVCPSYAPSNTIKATRVGVTRVARRIVLTTSGWALGREALPQRLSASVLSVRSSTTFRNIMGSARLSLPEQIGMTPETIRLLRISSGILTAVLIGNMNALRRRSPLPWPRHRDVTCQNTLGGIRCLRRDGRPPSSASRR
jgi:hypothetical protein